MFAVPITGGVVCLRRPTGTPGGYLICRRAPALLSVLTSRNRVPSALLPCASSGRVRRRGRHARCVREMREQVLTPAVLLDVVQRGHAAAAAWVLASVGPASVPPFRAKAGLACRDR